MDLWRDNHTVVVCLSTVSWQHPTPTNKQLLMGHLLARGPRVLYAEDPVLPHLFINQQRWKSVLGVANLSVLRPWKLLPWASRVPVIQYINGQMVHQQIVSRLQILHQQLPIRQLVLWVYEPSAHAYLPKLKSWATKQSWGCQVLVDIVDDYTSFPSSSHHEKLFCQALSEQADVLTVSAPTLLADFPNANFVPNGADLEPTMFDPPVTPPAGFEDFLAWKSRFSYTVGFLGTINFKVNLDLIANLTQENPSIGFVFIGPQDLSSNVKSQLPVGQNLFWGAGVGRHQLKLFYDQIQAVILPYHTDHRTHSVSPLKAWEALHQGLPIWSTPIPAMTSLNLPEDVFVDRWDDFLSALKQTATQEDRRIRIKAMNRSWGSRLTQLLRLLDENLSSAK